jgi:hypothetical protein
MLIDESIKKEFIALIEEAHLISTDVSREVDKILSVGSEQPLEKEEAVKLLTKLFDSLKLTVSKLGDKKGIESLKGNTVTLVEHILAARDRISAKPEGNAKNNSYHRVMLTNHNGFTVGPVVPKPWFHGKEIPMDCGWAKTTDIQLWENNERLDIHIAQFKQKTGRKPTPEEILNIMFGKMQMPGMGEDDQFKIIELARSIAINGVRKPPILDKDGTLIDGNRRVAACYYILNNDDEFTTEQKQRAEYIFAWQLTQHADDDDRRRVVVSLNFEPDYKIDWPEYVKAKKVHEEWHGMLAVESYTPGPKRQAEMKRELSQKYALGPDTSVVNRYIKMVDCANEFEEYHINEKRTDEYEVKHKANKYFQYFDELSKGSNPGGVSYVLGQDETYKKLAFDLLFQGKFNNWKDIRNLKNIYENEEARQVLIKAREEKDVDEAQDMVGHAGSIANLKKAEVRSYGANTRIEVFVKWLEELPIAAFRDEIKRDNLELLLKALEFVGKQAEQVLRDGANG